MRAGQDVLTDLRAALALEWVIPHGTGGSSSGTASGANARRAHALLTAAGAHGRLTTLLLKVDERLRGPAATWELGCNAQAGFTARPAGHLLLESFTLDPWPRWTWRAGEIVLEKALLPISGHDAVVIRYRLLEGPAGTLAVSPLVVARDPAALQREDPGLGVAVQGVPGRIQIQLAPGLPPLSLWHNGAFLPARVWQHNLFHPLEPGATEGEDAFVPGHIEAALAPGGELDVVAAAESDLFRALAREDRLGAPPPRTLADCVRVLERSERDLHAERERAAVASAAVTAAQAAEARESAAAQGGGAAKGAAEPGAGRESFGADATRDAQAPASAAGPGADEASSAAADAGGDPWIGALSGIVLGALTRGSRGLTIMGSLESGRSVAETLRVVPALVSLRAFEAVREILAATAEHLDDGVAPEGFDPDDGAPRYGDPAPSLWLVHGAELYARRSGDLEFVRQALYTPLESVIHSYRAGTRHGIRAGADGLLAAGEGGRRADLNALWYHALVAMAQLAKKTERKEAAAFYLAWAREQQTRFNAELWDEKRGALYDAIGEQGPARGLSPSQLLAVRIGPPVLAAERIERLVRTVERSLFTPLGLRTKPRGARVHTAWLGPFYSAYLRAHGRSAEAQARVREWLGELRARLALGAGGALPEWFELPPAARGEARGDRSGARDDGIPPEPVRQSDAAPAGGEPVSVLAAAELLPVWIEELDHAPLATPALIA
jgi:hypothetical protein